MFRRVIIMAATSSSEGKAVILDKVKPQLPVMNKMKAQIRSVNSKSSPVYKSNTDPTLVNGMRKLNLRNNTSNKPPTGRNFCIESGKVTIKSLSDIASVIRHQQAKNIVVVAGAGISTPSGIPDFRSPGTGLYDNLAQYNIPYPEAIFDIDYFHRNPRPFFTLAKELYPSGKYRPNYIHYFARLLHDKGQLLRMYTQNIDGLERLAGIPPSKLVEAHGTFATATCLSCGQRYSGEDIKDNIFNDKLPRCKRSGCAGTVKPDIVFFGEELPKRFYFYLKDMIQTDLVLVMGTSLEVYPFAGIIDNVRWNIPRVLFNRNAVGPFHHNKRSKDFLAEGDLLETVQKFVNMTEFKEEMTELIKKCEGEFKIASAPPIVQRQKPRNKLTDSYATRWKQQARMDLFKATFSFSSSSEDMSSSSNSTTTSSSSSSSSSSSGKKPKKNGQRKINKYSKIKTDVPSKRFSTSSRQRNGASVNPRMLKPLRGEWMKNPSKQPVSSSNREQDTKQRPTSRTNIEQSAKQRPTSRTNTEKSAKQRPTSRTNTEKSAKQRPTSRTNTEQGAKQRPTSQTNTEQGAKQRPPSQTNTEKSAKPRPPSVSNKEIDTKQRPTSGSNKEKDIKNIPTSGSNTEIDTKQRPTSGSNKEKDIKNIPTSGSNTQIDTGTDIENDTKNILTSGSSNTEQDTKPLSLSRSNSKNELSSEKDNFSKLSETKSCLEKEEEFVDVSPSPTVTSMTTRSSASIGVSPSPTVTSMTTRLSARIGVSLSPAVTSVASGSGDRIFKHDIPITQTNSDANLSPRKPFVRSLSVSPMMQSVGSRTYFRRRDSLLTANMDINGDSKTCQDQRVSSEAHIRTDSRRYSHHQTAKKNIHLIRRLGSERMPRLPNRPKQQRTVYDARILSYTVNSSTSSSDGSESEHDSR